MPIIVVKDVGPDALTRYGHIPISFTVESVLRPEVRDGGFGGIALREEPVQPPYVKDYDALDGEGPTRWAKDWDVSAWGFFIATREATDIGAAAVAHRTKGLFALEGRDDLAALWDIRVHPDHRRSRVGTALFRRAAAWARDRGCTQLHIETQNNNVGACRFYAKQGAVLGSIHRFAYRGTPAVAHEAMLLWYLDL